MASAKKAIQEQRNNNPDLPFPLKLDTRNRINISVWFNKNANQNQRLNRTLGTKRFKALVTFYCKLTDQTESDVIVQTTDGE